MRLTIPLAILMFSLLAAAQTISFEEYDPPSSLVVPEHPVTAARYPFVDVHNHQWNIPGQDLKRLTAQMDSLNMAVMVNLSGRSFRRDTLPDGTVRFKPLGSDFLKRSVERVREEIPGRVITFTNVEFDSVGAPGWIDAAVAGIRRDAANGAAGLKIYKNLGMEVVDIAGERVPVDDPRLDPIWAVCGELGLPVLIHTADPHQFWLPHDAQNERWLELKERPGRKRIPGEDPAFETLLAEQHHVFEKHPGTDFINAHLGWLGNDLARLAALLDRFPNVYTEIGAVLAELGRQPRFARQFFIDYQDRILFGKDAWTPAEYHVYFRVLETADEYFPYYRRRHAFWRMYGMDLPDAVLKKVYYQNALRIIPGIDRSLFPEN